MSKPFVVYICYNLYSRLYRRDSLWYASYFKYSQLSSSAENATVMMCVAHAWGKMSIYALSLDHQQVVWITQDQRRKSYEKHLFLNKCDIIRRSHDGAKQEQATDQRVLARLVIWVGWGDVSHHVVSYVRCTGKNYDTCVTIAIAEN